MGHAPFWPPTSSCFSTLVSAGRQGPVRGPALTSTLPLCTEVERRCGVEQSNACASAAFHASASGCLGPQAVLACTNGRVTELGRPSHSAHRTSPPPPPSSGAVSSAIHRKYSGSPDTTGTATSSGTSYG
jgi:hypothetical protein